MWGRSEFWGLGSEFDPDWVLTESQKKLRKQLIEVCITLLPFSSLTLHAD